MKFEVKVAGRTRHVELDQVPPSDTHPKGSWVCRLDGQDMEVDAVEVATCTYSILLEGQSFEVRVRPGVGGGLVVQTTGDEFPLEIRDPRSWRGQRGTVLEAEGRQQIIAPMPGKIIRVLIQAGATVEAGQGLLVVEAMKMQNEIRSPKNGTVERLHVSEGQAVNAGEILAVVA